MSERSVEQKEVEQLGALLGNHPSLCHVIGDTLITTIQLERPLKTNAVDSVGHSALPRAVQHEPVSDLQSFAPEHLRSRSPVELLEEKASVKQTGSGEGTKSICTGVWLYTPDHSVARSGINVW